MFEDTLNQTKSGDQVDRPLNNAIRRSVAKNQLQIVSFASAVGVAYYGLLAVAHPVLIPGMNGIVLSVCSALVALIMLAVFVAIRAGRILGSRCHTAAALLGLLGMLAVYSHIFITAEHIQLTLAPILPIVFGLLFAKRFYFLGLSFVATGLNVVALIEVPGPHTVHFAFLTVLGLFLGALAFFPRVAILSQMFSNLLQNRQKNRILNARNIEMQGLYKQAVKSGQAKSRFFSSMSHELRTPLNTVLGFGELLAEDIDDVAKAQQNKRHAERIVQSGQELLNLINNVLDVAAIDAGSMNLSRAPISVGPFMRSVKDMAHPLAMKSGAVLTLDSDRTLDAMRFMGDPDRCRQVLFNVVLNALKYGGKSVTVIFRAEKTIGNEIQFLVIDDGPGIPTELHEKMFEPFERLSNHAGPIEGAGVGLSVAKTLILQMGGTIGVAKDTGKGLTVYCRFPLAA